ncbi:ATP-binding protein [Kitasatospora sp. NPDC088346]|uniref:ATP-binding protein n=1 Tax=Kitasatospora sp. NPDC088346 TaxID=3364073 RepID=UPI0038089251
MPTTRPSGYIGLSSGPGECRFPGTAGHRKRPPRHWGSRSGPARSTRPLPLIVIDEVGCIPGEAQSPTCFLQFVSNGYERAGVTVTANKPFGRWGELLGDETVAAVMIDRLVHHTKVHILRASPVACGPRSRPGPPTPETTTEHDHRRHKSVRTPPSKVGHGSAAADKCLRDSWDWPSPTDPRLVFVNGR